MLHNTLKMNEKLLQYLWNFKIFNNYNFKDTDGNSIEIEDFGIWNTNAGPDFLMAKVKINEITLHGNIELHVKSSDWIFHQHSADPNYDNIILHVVFEDDTDIAELKNNNIPTLELKNHIDADIISKYQKLISETQFIACEQLFEPKKIPLFFFEETLINKLEEKSLGIETDLKKNQNNYEAVLFHSLAYSFGLKVNAELFKLIAESVDFTIINKIRQNKGQLEALLFGISDWLEFPEDEQMKVWKNEYLFLKAKFGIHNLKIRPKFLRLRPPNFPTLRLSQLANLYHLQQNLFSKVMQAKTSEELMHIFRDIKASEYWDHHYNFGKISPVKSPKIISKDFAELVILNSILPLKYTYHKHHNEEITDEILAYYKQLSSEKNTVIDGWKNLGLKTKNALESQALIYHYKNYCTPKNCLNCSIGFKILKEN